MEGAGGDLLPGCMPLPNRILKHLISIVLHGLLFTQNQPPKLADDGYLRILKNEIKN